MLHQAFASIEWETGAMWRTSCTAECWHPVNVAGSLVEVCARVLEEDGASKRVVQEDVVFARLYSVLRVFTPPPIS